MQQSINLSSAYLQKWAKRRLGQHRSGVELVVDNWAIPRVLHSYPPATAVEPLGYQYLWMGVVAWRLFPAVPIYFLFSYPKMSFVPNPFSELREAQANETERKSGW